MTPEQLDQFKVKMEGVVKASDELKESKKSFDDAKIKLEETNKQSTDNAQALAEYKATTEGLAEKVKEFDNFSEQIKTVQDHVDQIEKDAQKRQGGEKANLSFKGALRAGLWDLMAKEEVKAGIASKTKSSFNFDLGLKDMAPANLTSAVIDPVIQNQRLAGGPVYDPARQARMRDIINILPQSQSGGVTWTREVGSTGGAGMVAIGALKPVLDKDIDVISRPTQKIAVHERIPEEFINDTAWMQNYMVTRAVDSVLDLEDTQLLTGTGVGTNLFGFITEASAYVDTLSDANAHETDVLAAAYTQAVNAEYQPDGIVLSPTRVLDMLLRKDTQGRFLLPNVYTGARPTIMGVPVFVTTAIGNDAFLVGAFNRGGMVMQREGISVRFYDQDRDNAIANMVTVVVEERLTSVVERPNAFVGSTTFDANITAAQV